MSYEETYLENLKFKKFQYKICSGCYKTFWPFTHDLTENEKISPAFLCKNCKQTVNKSPKGNQKMKKKQKTRSKQKLDANVDVKPFNKVDEMNGRLTDKELIPGIIETNVLGPNELPTERKNADQPEDHWDSDLETVNACSKSPDNITVWVKPLAKVKIDTLMEKYPNIEWFAYLLGDGEDKLTVEDIHVPIQKITSTSVDDIECAEFNDLPIIGAIHSHHGMGTGFSGTDHAFVNQNHDISLVKTKTAIAGQVRWSTPCGCLKIVDAVVKPKIEVDFDKKSFLETAIGNITEKRYAQSQTGTSGFPANTGPGRNGPEVISGRAGCWVNGVWRPNKLTEAQKSYTNGKSIKETVKENAIIITGTEIEQSLMEALDESFPEEKEESRVAGDGE